MLCLAMPTDLSFFRYEIRNFRCLMEFRRFALRKHSQSDVGINLAFVKFDSIIWLDHFYRKHSHVNNNNNHNIKNKRRKNI